MNLDNLQYPRMELSFELDRDEGWPPVATEGIWVSKRGEQYQVKTIPLFVKNMSFDDIITMSTNENGVVTKWEVVKFSGHTTIWLLRLSPENNIEKVLDRLLLLGCAVVRLSELGAYSVDVPPEVLMSNVDGILEGLNPDEVAIAFPSFRHAD